MILPVPSQIARTQGSDAVIYYQVDQQTTADYPRGGAAASPTYRYFWASYIDEFVARKATGSGGELLFAHRNQQYSILSLSDSSGSVVERISYTAYGQPTFTNAAGTILSSSAKATRYSYTGREWDASLQLHHFRARWMSGVSGRFLGRDSMKFVSGMSMYSNYFFVTNTDPSGSFQLREYPSLELTSLVRQDPTVGILNPLPKPIEPSLPLDFPKLSNRNCAEFLRGFRTRHPIDPELSCNPNVYCAQLCNVGRGPGNSSQVVGGRCHICLNTSQNMNWLEWQAILIHELTHCTQFRRDHNCPCNKDAYVGKNPDPPMRIGGATYEDCVKYESEAYERQCKFLYDGKPDLEQLCIKSGVCNSCKNFPNAPQNCLPWPNYEDQPFKL